MQTHQFRNNKKISHKYFPRASVAAKTDGLEFDDGQLRVGPDGQTKTLDKGKKTKSTK